MPFAEATKNSMLDGEIFDSIRLHDQDPGPNGSVGQVDSGLNPATFSAAASGSRALASDVTVTGLAANQTVTHFSAWTTAGAVFKGSGTIDTGDTEANAAGEYVLQATNTTLNINDS